MYHALYFTQSCDFCVEILCNWGLILVAWFSILLEAFSYKTCSAYGKLDVTIMNTSKSVIFRNVLGCTEFSSSFWNMFENEELQFGWHHSKIWGVCCRDVVLSFKAWKMKERERYVLKKPTQSKEFVSALLPANWSVVGNESWGIGCFRVKGENNWKCSTLCIYEILVSLASQS